MERPGRRPEKIIKPPRRVVLWIVLGRGETQRSRAVVLCSNDRSMPSWPKRGRDIHTKDTENSYVVYTHTRSTGSSKMERIRIRIRIGSDSLAVAREYGR